MPSENDLKFGQAAVEKGFLTTEQMEQALADLDKVRSTGLDMSIGAFFLNKKLMSKAQVRDLMKELGIKPKEIIPGFEIVDKLGEGGMGAVYLARQIAMDRLCALKILPPKLVKAEAEFAERFLREARAVGQFSHPNIVSAYDVGKAGEYHYFAMEYVDGSSLRDLIKERGMLSEAEAVPLFVQMVMGLEHAASKGIVHRDIKPHNILLTKEGVPKIADFGLAKTGADSSLTSTGSSLGTPYYTSPEQAQGKKDLDVRSDLYSLGCTLFETVTGKVPFDGETPMEIAMAHVHKPMPDPRALNPKLSAGLCNIIKKMCTKDRDSRFQDCASLLKAFAELKQGGGKTMALKVPTDKGTQIADLTIEPEPGAKTPGGDLSLMPLEGESNAPKTVARAKEATSPRPSKARSAVARPVESAVEQAKEASSRFPLVPVLIGLGLLLFAVIAIIFYVTSAPTVDISVAEMEKLLKQATRDLDEKNYSQARAELNKLLKSYPQNAQALSLKDSLNNADISRARTLTEDGYFAEALEVVGQLLQDNPDWLEAQTLETHIRAQIVTVAEDKIMKEAEVLLDKSHSEKARERIDPLLKKYPNNEKLKKLLAGVEQKEREAKAFLDKRRRDILKLVNDGKLEEAQQSANELFEASYKEERRIKGVSTTAAGYLYAELQPVIIKKRMETIITPKVAELEKAGSYDEILAFLKKEIAVFPKEGHYADAPVPGQEEIDTLYKRIWTIKATGEIADVEKKCAELIKNEKFEEASKLLVESAKNYPDIAAMTTLKEKLSLEIAEKQKRAVEMKLESARKESAQWKFEKALQSVNVFAKNFGMTEEIADYISDLNGAIDVFTRVAENAPARKNVAIFVEGKPIQMVYCTEESFEVKDGDNVQKVDWSSDKDAFLKLSIIKLLLKPASDKEWIQIAKLWMAVGNLDMAVATLLQAKEKNASDDVEAFLARLGKSDTLQLVRITTEPAGATIILNGQPSGVTPLKVPLKFKETYELSIALEDYMPFKDKYNPKKDKDQLIVALKKAPVMSPNDALDHTRKLINSCQFVEAVSFININPKRIGRGYGPAMLRTANNFIEAENLINAKKYDEAQIIVNGISSMVCCELKDKIYPDALAKLTAQIDKGQEIERKKKELAAKNKPAPLPTAPGGTGGGVGGGGGGGGNVPIPGGSPFQACMTLLNQGNYQQAASFAAQNAQRIHPTYGPRFAQSCAVFLQASNLAASGQNQQAEQMVRSLSGVSCCRLGALFQGPVNVFLQKMRSGAFKKSSLDNNDRYSPGRDGRIAEMVDPQDSPFPALALLYPESVSFGEPEQTADLYDPQTSLFPSYILLGSSDADATMTETELVAVLPDPEASPFPTRTLLSWINPNFTEEEAEQAAEAPAVMTFEPPDPQATPFPAHTLLAPLHVDQPQAEPKNDGEKTYPAPDLDAPSSQAMLIRPGAPLSGISLAAVAERKDVK